MKTETAAPPPPPSGPPRGTNFSRRKLRQPLPPLPAATWMSTSSTNIGTRILVRGGMNSRPALSTGELFDRNDRDLAAVLAVILEADLAVDLREQGVVL